MQPLRYANAETIGVASYCAHRSAPRVLGGGSFERANHPHRIAKQLEIKKQNLNKIGSENIMDKIANSLKSKWYEPVIEEEEKEDVEIDIFQNRRIFVSENIATCIDFNIKR